MDEDIEYYNDNNSVFHNSVIEQNNILSNDLIGNANKCNNKTNNCCFRSKNYCRPNSLSISWNVRSSFDRKEGVSPALVRWFQAVAKILRREVPDELYPWQNFPLETIQTKKAVRYRYSAIKKKWVDDEIYIKLEQLPFDHGSMRECFRMKKLATQGVANNDWTYCSNYVAKRYIKDVPKEVYFEDVKLQMEAKLWAEEYNRQNPPKKVDIFQLSVLELAENDKRSFYHIEHFMEGNYRKYNSNSGYVDDGCLRNTPQAFSHFTFERSGHRIIIVDIQGVGDLYTDPQIHTADGLNYGDGNLGLRGMALFFSSHQCNPICQYLGLSEFDMHESEIPNCDEINNSSNHLLLDDNDDSEIMPLEFPDEDSCAFSVKSANECQKRYRSISFKMPGTVVRNGRESPNVSSPAFLDNLFPAPVDLIRAMSVDSGVQSASVPFYNIFASSVADSDDSFSSLISGGNSQINGAGLSFQQSDLKSLFNSSRKHRKRQRNYSDGSDIDVALLAHEDYLAAYHQMRENQKPSNAGHPTNLDEEIGHSILAQVHHELARIHESGRIARSKQEASKILHRHFWSHLVNNSSNSASSYSSTVNDHGVGINWDACLFHERHAAQLGCLEAVIVMARYSLNMTGHMLQECSISPSDTDKESGMDYLWRAADSGDRRSMIELANMYRSTETKLEPSSRNYISTDWAEAVKWYKRAFEAVNKADGQVDSKDAEGKYDSADDLMPQQEILAAMAELYLLGGYSLEKNCTLAGELYSEAADIATNALKGRQAAKYYELAELAFCKADENNNNFL